MIYEKPQLIDFGMSEGVYAAGSGDINCDCFTYKIELQTRRPDSYFCSFTVYPNDSRTHMESEYWGSKIQIVVTFNQDIPADCAGSLASNETFTGNKLTMNINYIEPASGNCSYHSIQLSGTGAENLSITSIEVTHV